MRNMPGELAWFVGLIYQPPPSPPPSSFTLSLSLSLLPVSLFLTLFFIPFKPGEVKLLKLATGTAVIRL